MLIPLCGLLLSGFNRYALGVERPPAESTEKRAEVVRGEQLSDTAYVMVRSTSFQPLHIEIRFDVDVLNVSSIPPALSRLQIQAENGVVKIMSSGNFTDNAVDLSGLEVIIAGGDKVRLKLPPISIAATAYSKDFELPSGTITRNVPSTVKLPRKLEFDQKGLGGAAAQLSDELPELTHQQRMGLIIYMGLDKNIFIDHNVQRIRQGATLNMEELEALAIKISPAEMSRIYTTAKNSQWRLKKDQIALYREPMEEQRASPRPDTIPSATVSEPVPGFRSSKVSTADMDNQIKRIRTDLEAFEYQFREFVSKMQSRDLVSYFGSISFLVTAFMVSIILYMKYVQQRKILSLDRSVAELNERAETLRRSVEEAARRSAMLKKNVDETQRISRATGEIPELWNELRRMREEIETLAKSTLSEAPAKADEETSSNHKESGGDEKKSSGWKLEIT